MKKETKPFKTMLVAAAAAIIAGPVAAAPLNWTGPGGTTASPTSGIWDTNTANWDNGAGAVVFNNGDDGAVFGGADGVYFIECTNNFRATNITVTASGYAITSSVPVIIDNTTLPQALNVAAGKTFTIGTNVTVQGSVNQMVFQQNNSFSGTLIVDNGGRLAHNQSSSIQFGGGPGSTIRILDGGYVGQVNGTFGGGYRFGTAAGSAFEMKVEGGVLYVGASTAFNVGNNSGSTGIVTVASGAVSNNLNATILAAASTAVGVVNLNGGAFYTRQVVKGNSGGTATLNFNGGTLAASAASTAFITGLDAANIRNAAATVDNAGFNITIPQKLAHSTLAGDAAADGGLIFTGSGVTTLSATNTYTGPTIVSNGVMSLGVSGLINSSSLIEVQGGGTLNLSNQLVFNSAGTFSLVDGTVQLSVNDFPTNIVTGTLATGGSANLINIPVILGSGSIPQTTPLIKYASLAPGVVDGNNNLTTLNVSLPAGFGGYLSNNVAQGAIDLVLTSGSLKPQIVNEPVSVARYRGLTAQFSVTALGADAYFWRSNGMVLSDGGGISGAATSLLTISNVSGTADFDVVLTNASGSVTSLVASLTVIDPVNYAGTNVSLSPVSYYRFSETDSSQPAHDYVGGKDGVYLANAFHVPGPLPADGYVNFENDNEAVQCVNGFADAHVVVSNSWSINTNTVTLAGWIYPVGGQLAHAGVIFNRGGGVCGLNYTGTTNGDGNFTLGYTWNNDGNTYNWDSGLVPPLNQWSLVALVVTPTNATVYVGNTNGFVSSVHTYAHPAQAFNGPIAIGSDEFAPSDRAFTGYIDEVAAFNRALGAGDLLALMSAASGVTNFPPNIATQPASAAAYEHQTVQFTAQVSGSEPLIYQWMRGSSGVYTNVPAGLTVDGSVISGGNSHSLVISNVSLNDASDYVLLVTNSAGQAATSVATLTVNPVLPATNITTSVIQGGGNNWDTDGTWSLAGSATSLAAEYYGSTFTVLAPGGLRTPDLGNPNSPTTASFPGDVLRVEGNGSLDTSLTAAGAIRIKGGNPATVYFKKLQMAGGQICSILNNGWPAILTGEVNVISNTVVWASDDTHPRSLTVQSTLTGDGSIQYHGYISTSTFRMDTDAALNIANADNPYTGTWNVELGTLVGSAANALGTNTITVGPQGALQTTYDLNNPDADLILNGRMNLTQNDTFRQVTINGQPLPAGTHAYTELTNAYPANFPAAWTGVTGALTATNVMGSITVLAGGTASYPTNILFSVSGSNLSLSWPATHLGWYAQSNSVALANTNYWFDIPGSETVTSLNLTITPGQTNVFYRLRHP